MEILNMINTRVLPANRDVYTVKTFSDLPWAELGILSVAGVGIHASSTFYCDKTFVFNPTGISGEAAEVRKSVSDTLYWITGILTCFKVKSVTLILNGNIWQYFQELLPLALLVYLRNATIYVNKRSYNQDLGLLGAPAPQNRLNIVIHEGHRGGRVALLWALHCGSFARQDSLGPDQLRFLFNLQTQHLKYPHGVLPREFPFTRTTSFRFPGLPNSLSGPPNALPGFPNAHPSLTNALAGLPGLASALAGLQGLPSALAGLPGYLNAPPGPLGLSTDLIVYLRPGDVMYSSSQAASYCIRTHDWNRWTHLSQRLLVNGPRASQRVRVTNTLIPTLAIYHHKLWTETRRIWTYMANHPTVHPNHPLPLPSTLGDREGFGSWIGFTVPLLSARERLGYLREERIILRRFLALMMLYGVVNQSAFPSRFRLIDNGISRV
jgi:hypothetical protein